MWSYRSIINFVLGELSINAHSVVYRGNYSTWDEALSASDGYDTDLIVEKVRGALLRVKNGEAVYERDSVLFDRVQHAWPLLSGLLWNATRNQNRLCLVDYGGSLGSSYFQNRPFLEYLDKLRWCIVEQPKFVECGKKEFESEELRFYASLDACLTENEPTLLLLSSVVQYLDEPYVRLGELLKWRFDTILIDRTPFLPSGTDRITVQHVPAEIYPASYPAWLFDEAGFKSFFMEQFDVMAEFPSSADIPHDDITYKGFMFRRKAR